MLASRHRRHHRGILILDEVFVLGIQFPLIAFEQRKRFFVGGFECIPIFEITAIFENTAIFSREFVLYEFFLFGRGNPRNSRFRFHRRGNGTTYENVRFKRRRWLHHLNWNPIAGKGGNSIASGIELFDAIFRDRRAYSLWSPRRRLESFLVQILYRSLDDLVFSEAARGRESCDQ